MNNIADLSQARSRKQAETQAAALQIRDELLAYGQVFGFPGEQLLDQGTQQPTLDEEGEIALTRMFELFGITELSPLDPDFDLVTETWYRLTGVVRHLESRRSFKALYTRQRTIWHPPYAVYIDALWDGDLSAVAKCARVLNIQQGIPEGAALLWDGPLPGKKGRIHRTRPLQ